mgnify:CR=1 FL=1
MNRFQKCLTTGLIAWVGALGTAAVVKALQDRLLFSLSLWLPPVALTALLWLIPALWLALLSYAVAKTWRWS